MAGKAISLRPDRMEKVLGALALVMLAVVILAVLRGSAEWSLVPLMIWVHLATIGLPLLLTPVLMWSPRGTKRHRTLGYIWVVSMTATAIGSYAIRSNNGHFSAIHILSTVTLGLIVVLVIKARRRRIADHRRAARGIIIGALLIAGFFTFPFNRLLGYWLLG